jgi:hypothetical protein
MQCDLACEIFKFIFGDPSTSRFCLVAHIDWSQGHAGMTADSHNAENMLCGTGGATAKHLKATSWRHTRNGFPISFTRNALCQGNCEQCFREFKANMELQGTPQFDQFIQTIGVKGLRQVLQERGFRVTGPTGKFLTQSVLIEMLQTCSDFQAKNLITRAHVTDLMRKHGYVALFGVKYHAELAWVERKWMMIKRKIRPKLNGRMPRLKELLEKHWASFTLEDGRKAARHCRESIVQHEGVSIN